MMLYAFDTFLQKYQAFPKRTWNCDPSQSRIDSYRSGHAWDQGFGSLKSEGQLGALRRCKDHCARRDGTGGRFLDDFEEHDSHH